MIRSSTPLLRSKSLSYQTYNRRKGKVSPTLLWKIKKNADFGKKALIESIPKSSAVALFFVDFLRKCLSKCPNSKKPPLPWKSSGCAPAYISYKQPGFCSLEPYWQYLQKSWWSSGMIPEKVTWVRFPARINTVYSKLPPINDLFLKILNQT